MSEEKVLAFCTKCERHLTTATCAKPKTGFMSAQSPKGALNLAKRWLFASVIQDTSVERHMIQA